jgi:1,4-alpha-glucan branching enzyme
MLLRGYFSSALKEDSGMSNKEKKSFMSKGKEEKEVPKKADKNVEFTLHAPEATEVYLTGEFNCWSTQSLPMKKDKDGVWRTQLRLLPGRYEYKLFADDAWIENLPNAQAVPNPFGTQNFVITVK